MLGKILFNVLLLKYFLFLQINSDFNKFYPGKELKLYTKWATFIETILSLKSGSLRDACAKELLESRSETDSEDNKITPLCVLKII